MTRRKALGSLWLLVPLLLLVAPRFVFQGGILHFEARKFLLHFTSDHSFLAKVFDPDENDLGDHRGRELSSVVDFVDAQWVDASIRRGRPSFLPISWLVGSTAIVCLVLAKTRRLFPRVGPGTTCLLLGLFLSDPVVFLNARCYVRSAKMDAAVALLLLVYAAWESLGGRRAVKPVALGLAAFGASLAISLMDEQGAFLAGVVAFVAFVASALDASRDRPRLARAAALLGGVGAGVVASRALYRWVSPGIIHALNGYWPNHDYETGKDAAPLSLETVRLAAGWLADQASYALGNLGGGVSLALVGLSVLVVAKVRDGARRPVAWSVLVATALAAACLVVMATLMIQRHPPVAQEDVRRAYYGLPVLVLALFGATLAADRASPLLGRGRAFLDAGLLALVLCNVVGLENHARVSVSNHLRAAAADTPVLREILRTRQFTPVDPRFDRQTNLLLRHYAAVLGTAAVSSAATR